MGSLYLYLLHLFNDNSATQLAAAAAATTLRRQLQLSRLPSVSPVLCGIPHPHTDLLTFAKTDPDAIERPTAQFGVLTF